MSIDLLSTVQKNLGYQLLKKIDPNTDEPLSDSSKPSEDRLTQAVVPTVLAGIYKLAKNEEGVKQIALETETLHWPDIIFAEHKKEVVKNIASYSYYSEETVEDRMEEVAVEAIKVIRENSKSGENFTDTKNFISTQRNNILPYLPASLHIGNMLDDTTIDDATAKMTGPISSLMHKIETGMSGNETKEDVEKKGNGEW
jgi:hypothetical protein